MPAPTIGAILGKSKSSNKKLLSKALFSAKSRLVNEIGSTLGYLLSVTGRLLAKHDRGSQRTLVLGTRAYRRRHLIADVANW
jgi:hypothetical protein